MADRLIRLWGGPWLLERTETETIESTWTAKEVAVPAGPSLNWVVIETGSNQAYVFATDKRRANVGASRIIKSSCTDWVDRAIEKLPKDRVTVVVKASGKAILLVGGEDSGRSIVRAVTHRALEEAPGLDVWGVLHPVQCSETCKHDLDSCDLGRSLKGAHRELARIRSTRPNPAQRAVRTPFTEPCALTGRAASMEFRDGSGMLAVSAQSYACLLAGSKDRDRKRWPGVQQDLNKELASGWVAVLHADGNGIGKVFQTLDETARGDLFLPTLMDLSQGIEDVTMGAVSAAADAVQETVCGGAKDRHSPIDCEGGRECQWWLPLVIGGDDVTALLRGDVALQFAERLLRSFSEMAHSRAWPPAVKDLSMTMSAGLAFVKPHHPFNQAYDLAEELCDSAKTLPSDLRGSSAVDALVLYDSVGQSLGDLRRHSSLPSPVVSAGQANWRKAHDFESLRSLMSELRSKSISSRRSHSVRSALIAGGPVLSGMTDVVVDDGQGWKTDWIDAMTLVDAEATGGPA